MKTTPAIFSSLNSSVLPRSCISPPVSAHSPFIKTLARSKTQEKPTPNISRLKSILINFLSNNEVDRAHEVFPKFLYPDVKLCTMMINGYSQIYRIADALQLFDKMPNRDVASWNSIIKCCLDCGDLQLAWKLFDEMPEKSVVSWTTMITGLAQLGRVDAAEELFARMPYRDTAAWNSMISGYSNHGRVLDARMLFDRMPQRNVISWTVMIGGYDRSGESSSALNLFRKMLVSGVKPTSSTFACVLTACANAPNLSLGTQLHGLLMTTGSLFDAYISSSLVNLYANCKEMDCACKMFHESEYKNVVSWTALVTGYGLNGRHEDALDEFSRMLASGVHPNQSSLTSALNSCCKLEAVDRGMKIHTYPIKQGLDTDVFVGNSLVAMYSRCGAIEDALVVFNNMSIRNLVSWNSIIVGCAQNGYASWALKLHNDMEACFMKPDEITFVGLLTACSHAKMLDKGRQFFNILKQDPSLELKLEHYACMVDVLGRSGRLEEAEEFIKTMPVEPNTTVWLALLSACKVHSNIYIARKTAQRIFYLDPSNSAAYVLLSNIYASAGRWNDVSQTRVMMRCRGIVKLPGYSWITIKESRHEFVCGDRSHPLAKEIYQKLDWLAGKLKEFGYVYDKKFAMHDVDDEQKEAGLAYHSERIAIAFGLLTTPDGATLRVMKNLRVCGDCHSAIKLISAIASRKIVLRDSTRFHHFINSNCSCGDYW